MSDYETTPTPDARRGPYVTDVDDELDDLVQEENAATSLDQPSDQSS